MERSANRVGFFETDRSSISLALMRATLASSGSEPILQNRLVLYRVEFGDLLKRITFALQYGSSAKNSFNSSSDSALLDSSCGRDRRAGNQEAAIIVALLQELAMRGYELGSALFKWDQMLSLQEEVLHFLFSKDSTHGLLARRAD